MAKPIKQKALHDTQRHGFRFYFYSLIGLNVITNALPWAALAILGQEAKQGVSGTEFFGILLSPILLFGLIVCAANIILLPLWLRKYKPTFLFIALSCIVMLASLVYLGVAIKGSSDSILSDRRADRVLTKEEAIGYITSCHAHHVDQSADGYYPRAQAAGKSYLSLDQPINNEGISTSRLFNASDFNDVAKAAYDSYDKCGAISVIYGFPSARSGDEPVNLSKDKAAQLLTSCQIQAVYWRDDTSNVRGTTAADYGNSGLAYDYIEHPVALWMQPKMVATMTPLINQAEKTCGHIPVFHNYAYRL